MSFVSWLSKISFFQTCLLHFLLYRYGSKESAKKLHLSILFRKENQSFPAGPLALRRTHVTVHEGKIRPVRTDGVLNPS